MFWKETYRHGPASHLQYLAYAGAMIESRGCSPVGGLVAANRCGKWADRAYDEAPQTASLQCAAHPTTCSNSYFPLPLSTPLAPVAPQALWEPMVRPGPRPTSQSRLGRPEEKRVRDRSLHGYVSARGGPACSTRIQHRCCRGFCTAILQRTRTSARDAAWR